MAFSTSGSTAEHPNETQETMFESAAEFPGHDLNEGEISALGHSSQAEDLDEAVMSGEVTDDAEFQTDFEDYEQASGEQTSGEQASGEYLRQESLPPTNDSEFGHRHSELSQPNSAVGSLDLAAGLSTGTAKVSPDFAAASPAYPNPDPDPAPEPSPTPDPDPEPPNLPLTISDFAALEDRVLRAVDLVRRERQGRAAAEDRVGSAEERAGFQEGRAMAAEARAVSLESELHQLQGQTPAIELLQQEIDSLRQEREQVRQRVERLLGQLDALEL